MKTLVSAFNSALPSDNLPAEIVYLPEGSHTINATANGRAKVITVHIPSARGEAITAKLQAALTRRLSAAVLPRIAFDHAAGGPAAAHPKGFRWEPGKGIVLALDWSNSGRTAVEGGDYSYFSPTFLLGDDGTPDDLPERGEIGSLVAEPAFRDIGHIAAADAGDGEYFARVDALIAAGDAKSLDDAVILISAADPGLHSSFIQGYEEEAQADRARREADSPEVKRAAFDRLEAAAQSLVAKGTAPTMDEARAAVYSDPANAADYGLAFTG